MTGISITLEQNLNWMKSFQNLKRKSEQMQEIIKNRDGSERRFNTDKIIGWKYNVTIKDGQFKKKSTQVSVDNPDALVDNDYIQAMDEVPVTFDNLQATMISTTMYYKADAIHLVDVKQK